MRKESIKSQDEELNLFNWMEKAPSVGTQDETMLQTTICVQRKSTANLPPLLAQYEAMKKKYPDSILLFRVGDFYETFCEDAVFVSEILKITLTRRCNAGGGVELAGFPHHALDKYLPKLVRSGKRVAICEQLLDPFKKK